ncbi:MAG: putative bifunctional diguanylate cyclase/phosphodiesterase [Acidimicrobiales bacterium]
MPAGAAAAPGPDAPSPSGTGPPAGGRTGRRTDEVRAKAVLTPRVFSYLVGPMALGAILLLRHYGAVAHEPPWAWLAVFVAVPVGSVGIELVLRRHPTVLWHHVQVAGNVAAVTVVIYMTGWGPCLVGMYLFIALVNVSADGAGAWRRVAAWTVAGVLAGEVAVGLRWAPSFLSADRGESLALIGLVGVLFVIRLTGATVAQKERAESALRTSEERFRSLVQHSSDTTLLIDPDGVVVYASPATTQLLGIAAQEVEGSEVAQLVHPDDRRLVVADFAARSDRSRVTEPLQFRVAHRDGGWRHAEAIVVDRRDHPAVGGFVANLRDITERKEAETLLAHQALHDPLTGIPNRTLILDRAEQMLARARRDHQPVAVLFVDLDNFKDINDSLGHGAGDRVLKAVATRFTASLRSSDTVGRLGGDEFVVLAEGLSLAAGPELLAERLHDVLREPFRLEGFEQFPLSVTASIGVAVGDRPSAGDLLRDADIALYRAKALGKHRTAVFEPGMQSEALDRLALEMDLRTALAEEQFFLLYQPVVALDDLSACGVEALLRWQHPTRGVVAPYEFIPALEESGLILDVGRWVLGEACRRAAEWRSRGYPLSMSVNVSARQLDAEGFFEDVRTALAESALPAGSLVLEVTETMLMRDTDLVVGRLRELKSLGVRIAIDDFGTGYSSLAYLRQFPVDLLKIDQSFIATMAESPESMALIHTLVELGRALGLETLAEGIEERSQLEALQRERCQHGQGFLFSRPVPPEEVERLFSSAGFGLRSPAAPGDR